MIKNWSSTLAVSSLLLGVVVLLVVPTANAKDEPAVSTTAVTESDIAFLKKGLSKKPKDSELNTLKATAMMLALYSQNSITGPDGATAAGQRDQALLIAAALKKKDFPAAKAALEGLPTAKEGDSKAILKLEEQHGFDLNELMSQFALGRSGGRHIEADLKAQATKVTDLKLAADLAARVVTIGQYTAVMLPADAVGAKKKTWDDLSVEMIQLGTEAAGEVAKGATTDKAVLAKKLGAINLNCKSCHDVFRNN